MTKNKSSTIPLSKRFLQGHGHPQIKQGFVLRYGTQVVGILNKSFGEYFKPYSSTSSALVKREERHD